jgi:hypothetical protein
MSWGEYIYRCIDLFMTDARFYEDRKKFRINYKDVLAIHFLVSIM